MITSSVAGIVFANVNDVSLKELTTKRSMASVPFGARYRLIDFPLSNLVNAGITSVGVITKENYRSLMDHLGSGIYWDLDRKKGGLYLLPPFMSSGVRRYTGTVDALNGAMDYINRSNADYFVICQADVVANIDISSAVDYHIKNEADITVVYHHGSLPLDVNALLPKLENNGRVTSITFDSATNDETDFCIGVMIFSKDVLVKLVKDAYADGYENFSRDVVAKNTDKLKIYGFEHSEYVAILDSTKAYYKASEDLLDTNVRRQLFNKKRPIFTKTRNDMPTRYGTKSSATNCFIGDGCVINGTVKNSILFRGVKVEKGAVVENCILMQETTVGENANLKYVISDKNAVIDSGVTVNGTEENSFFINKNEIL